MSVSLHERLSDIQRKLKVEKAQFNKFGGYSYRSTEDILEGVKPLLNGLVLSLDEEMQLLAGHRSERFYKITIASISDGKDKISVRSVTREDESQKGLTQSQLSGAISSYGAKMALRGLFLLDDSKDDDATNDHGKKTVLDDKTKEEPKKAESNADKSSEDKPSPTSFRRRKLTDDEGI